MYSSQQHIQESIKSYCPKLISPLSNRLASVALLLRHVGSDAELFFIRRAENSNDPWSGQVAFPGGNRELQDQDVIETARRETFEEVGIELPQENILGRLDDLQGRNNNREIALIISCLVFYLDAPQNVTHSVEVGDSFWISLTDLQDESRKIAYQTDYAPEPYPGIELQPGVVLWGLTYRFVQSFLKIIQ